MQQLQIGALWVQFHTEASVPPEAMVHSPQDGRMGPPISDYNAP